MISNVSDNSGILLFLTVKGWVSTWAAMFMIMQTKERWIYKTAEHEMLLCRGHLWSRMTLDATSPDEPLERGKKKRFCWLLSGDEVKRDMNKSCRTLQSYEHINEDAAGWIHEDKHTCTNMRRRVARYDVEEQTELFSVRKETCLIKHRCRIVMYEHVVLYYYSL